ncbi:unnamed protein product [Urochloa humidicola]
MDDAERRRELEELQSKIDQLTDLLRRLKEIEDEAQMHEHDDEQLAVAGSAVSYDDSAADSLLQHRDPVPMASGEFLHPDHLYPLLNSPFDEPEEDDAMQIEIGYQGNDYEYQDGTGHLHLETGEAAGSGDHYILPDPALYDDDGMLVDGEATPVRFSDGGFGGVPASAAAIRALKKQRYDGSSGTDSMCVICMRDYKKKGKRLYVMPCAYKHRFHRKCLKKWLSHSHLCPLCRHALPT